MNIKDLLKTIITNGNVTGPVTRPFFLKYFNALRYWMENPARLIPLGHGKTCLNLCGRTGSLSVVFPYTDKKLKSIAENERDHIVATLKSCNWKVYGPGGAAELLQMNVSTLNSRMKKLGIEKEKNY